MSDSLDDLIHGAFAQFDAEERGSGEPAPGAATVRGTVTRRRRIRYASLSLLLVALVAVPVALVTTVGHDKGGPPPVGSTSTAPSPSVSPSAVVPTGPLTVADPRNGTITMPAFPGYANDCQAAGPRTFVDGVYRSSNDVIWSIGELAPIEANLDGKPGNELLTTVSCHTGTFVYATQLIALSVGPDGALSVLGFVINSPDAPNLDFSLDQVKVTGDVVSVTTTGPTVLGNRTPSCYHQVRGYAYRNGTFVQVSGPTKFPPLPKDIHNVNWPDAGVLIDVDDPSQGGGASYCVVLSHGAGHAETNPGDNAANAPVDTTFTLGPVSYATGSSPGSAVAVGLVTYQRAGEPLKQSVQVFGLQDGSLVATSIVVTGDNEVTGIVSAAGSGKQITVALTVNGKRETWIFKMATDTGVWTHIL